jgi:phage terminase large subunit
MPRSSALLKEDASQAPIAPTTIMPPYTETWPPDYNAVYRWRAYMIRRYRTNPKELELAKRYYKNNPIDFINHWCTTVDPRNAQSAKLTYMPMVMFFRQAEMVEFVYDCLYEQEHGLIEKCREFGATWIACCISVHLWLFHDGTDIGWGSRIASLVDVLGVTDSIFEKLRIVIRELPEEFFPVGFSQKDHFMIKRIINPELKCSITGEVGDSIGRGGRKRIFFVDEAAHLEHPEMIEDSLLSNTRVRIDLSSVSGSGTVFHSRRNAGVEWYSGADIPKGIVRVLVLDWKDHPEKTQEWYDREKKQKYDQGLSSVFARNVDRDYRGAAEGIIIPGEWVDKSIDSHVFLGYGEIGGYCAGLDVADDVEGNAGDFNALAIRKGVVLNRIEEWGGFDTSETARRAAVACKNINQPMTVQYDAIGIGAGVKGDVNQMVREGIMPRNVLFVPWLASASVRHPEANVVAGDKGTPKNEDFFENFKAQAWWDLRLRFWRTYRAMTEKDYKWKPEDLISINSRTIEPRMLIKLKQELSQPTIGQSKHLKLLVNKKPDGTRSPNLADSIVQCFFPSGNALIVPTPEVRAWAKSPTPRLPRGRRFRKRGY